jgi:replicative DNA helicase
VTATVHALDPRDEPDSAPSNLMAEMAVLGAILFDNAALDAMPPGLKAGSFHEPFHQRLFDVVSQTIRAGRLAEPNLIVERLRDDPAFASLGGLVYLADLIDRAPAQAHVPEYGREVMDAALRRDLIHTASTIIKNARDAGATGLDRLNEAGRALDALTAGAPSHAAWKPAHDVAVQAVQTARERAGRIDLPFGLTDLDKNTGGLRRGEMTIIAGRPAMGKSSAGLAVARSLASRGKGVAFFSMEMPDTPLGLRMACDEAFDRHPPVYCGRSRNPTYFAAERHELDADQWRDLEAAAGRIAGWPLMFDTRPGLTPSVMESAARKAFRDWERQGVEPGAVIVDHLTIARSETDRKGNKVAEVGDVSRALAEMAKRLNVPVVALCQLSRQVEARGNTDRRPELADLRWSGEIEQDARQVIFLYRPEYYVKEPEDKADMAAMVEYRASLDKVRNKLFWLVRKNNNGPVCQVETYCDISCSAIRDREAA